MFHGEDASSNAKQQRLPEACSGAHDKQQAAALVFDRLGQFHDAPQHPCGCLPVILPTVLVRTSECCRQPCLQQAGGHEDRAMYILNPWVVCHGAPVGVGDSGAVPSLWEQLLRGEPQSAAARVAEEIRLKLGGEELFSPGSEPRLVAEIIGPWDELAVWV